MHTIVFFVIASVLTLIKTKKFEKFKFIRDDLFLKKIEKMKNDEFNFQKHLIFIFSFVVLLLSLTNVMLNVLKIAIFKRDFFSLHFYLFFFKLKKMLMFCSRKNNLKLKRKRVEKKLSQKNDWFDVESNWNGIFFFEKIELITKNWFLKRDMLLTTIICVNYSCFQKI